MRHGDDILDYFAIVDRLSVASSLMLRHDLCSCSAATALAFARAESERGHRATYFLLPSEPYWSKAALGDFVRALIDLGHGIGLHHDALSGFLVTCKEPRELLLRALDELRRHADVTLAAAHGAPSCYTMAGHLRYANYESFSEFDPARNVGGAGSWSFERVSAKECGLVETYLHGEHDLYLSDSGGAWHGWSGDPRPRPFERYPEIDHGLDVVGKVRPESRAQVLAHPCWWRVQ